ncbi:hypothetical protein AC579_400 [Pseudocercospora musae]|uniref:Uncharacterized protein n=1 Tax=Pseudocercospora musae TaxID=113226 RepID=A0A139H647_9PEZI|nr:hypothetical protein AC579_400 [Pseudocercospora musae]
MNPMVSSPPPTSSTSYAGSNSHNSMQHRTVILHLLRTHLSWTPEKPCLMTTTSRPRRQCRSRDSIMAQNIPEVFEKCLIELAKHDSGQNRVETPEDAEALRWVLELVDIGRCERHKKSLESLSSRKDFDEKVLGLVRKIREIRLSVEDLLLLQPSSVAVFEHAIPMSDFVRLSLENLREMWEEAEAGRQAGSSNASFMPGHESMSEGSVEIGPNDEEGYSGMAMWFDFEEASSRPTS